MVIAKRIDRKKDVADRYDRLAKYIIEAPEEGEKLDQFWTGNLNSGQDLEDADLAIKEVLATQKFNTRAKSDKTYHLVVSFRDGDKPTPTQVRMIAQEYLEALGFEDHQFMAGTHDNTENYHLHIAINKVHPKTHNLRTPHKDFHILDDVSRRIEKKYGLKVDNGIADARDKGRQAEVTAARDFEAQTWEESFLSYARRHKPDIHNALQESKSWQDLNTKLADYDLQVRARGAGLIITNLENTKRAKASAVDRAFSKAKLEAQLGPFDPKSQAVKKTALQSTYTRRPITHHADTRKLWRKYLGTPNASQSAAAGKPMKSWKQYLMVLLATQDPLATAIIMQQKREVNALLGWVPTSPPKLRLKTSPRESDVQQRWREAKRLTQPHDYLMANSIEAHGLKVDDQDRLMVPARDKAGKLVGFEYIAPDGQREFSAQKLPRGAHHLIEIEAETTKAILVACDYETAASAHKATLLPTVVAFSPDNMAPVIDTLRTKYPEAELLILGESGPRSKAINQVAKKAGLPVIKPTMPGRDNAVTLHTERRTMTNGLNHLNELISFHTQLKLPSHWVNREANRAVFNNAAWAGGKHPRAKKDAQGALLVPARDTHGFLQSYLKITSTGEKSFGRGGVPEGSFHIIDGFKKAADPKDQTVTAEGTKSKDQTVIAEATRSKDQTVTAEATKSKDQAVTEEADEPKDQTVLVVADYEQGLALFRKTRQPVAVAFTAQNIPAVQTALARKYKSVETVQTQSTSKDRSQKPEREI